METAKLCRCNNCMSILIDENPQIGAKEHDLSEYPDVKSMRILSDNDDNEWYWGCPECLTDAYLMDI